MLEVTNIGFILFFCYPLLLISIAIYFSITKEMNIERYYYADKNINWFILGLSLGSTAFFSPYLLGFTQKGFVSGLPLIYAVISCIVIYFYNKFLLPRFLKENIKSIPEYFEKRYNKTCRYFISSLYILGNMGIRLLITIVAGSFLIYSFTKLDPYFSLLFFLLITSVYLIIGGMKSEIYISAVEIAFVILVFIGFGYWYLLKEPFIENNVSFYTNYFTEFDSIVNLVEIIIGLSIISFWFLVADQVIFQKSLCVRDSKNTKKSYRVLAVYQIIPVLVFSLPSVIIFNYGPNNFQIESIKKFLSSVQFPGLLKYGIIISIFFALVSNFANSFYSTTNLVTHDFYRSVRPKASNRELVLAGRITLILLLFVSILLISIFQSYDLNLLIKLFYLLLYFASMTSALLLASLFINILRQESALVTLVLSTTLIIFKFICELFFDRHPFDVYLLNFYAHLNFLQYSIFIFSFTLGFHVLLSNIIRVFAKEKFEHGRKLSKLISKEDINRKVFLAFPVCFAIVGILEIMNI